MTYNKVVIDAHVRIDINMQYVTKRNNLENWIKRLKSEASDVKYFIRDHKSMDINDVYVVEEYRYVCEFCNHHFIEMNNKPVCCREAILEWATKAQLIELGFDDLKITGE